MKTTILFRNTLTLAGMSLLITPGANAQSNSPIRLELAPAQLPAVQVEKRAPLKTSEVCINPMTGRVVRSTDLITLPDGRRILASELRRSLAKYEAELNHLGYSLYTPNGPVMRQGFVQDTARFKTQAQELKADHKVTPDNPEALTSQMSLLNAQTDYLNQFAHPGQTEMAITPQMAQDLDGLKPVVNNGSNNASSNAGSMHIMSADPLDKYYTYYKQMGDASSFQAYLYSNVHVYGGSQKVGFQATGMAGGAIFGNYFVLLNGEGDGVSQNGAITGHIGLNVLGATIINKSYNVPVAFSGDKNWSMEVAQPYHIWIGPIPVGGRVGVRGKAGLKYNGGLYGGTVSANVSPYANVSGFAEAGVDIWFAGAGVGGELTFLKDTLNMTASAYLGGAKGRPTITASVVGYNNINTLSGRLYVWGQLFGFQGEHDFYNWSGFSAQGYLFNDSTTLRL